MAEPGRRRAKHDHVVRHIERRVAEGVYRPGDRVPSVREMAKILGVAVATVVDAYDTLESQGVLAAKPKAGYFVQLRNRVKPRQVSQPDVTPHSLEDETLFLSVFNQSVKPGVVQLATADPGLNVLPRAQLARALRQAARQFPDEAVAYDKVPGWRPLREQVARRAQAFGCEIDPDEIVTTAGCSEALSLALRAVCKPGDIVAVESPGYYGVLEALRLHGLRVLEIPTCAETGMELDALQEALDVHDIRAILLTPNFSNPLGSLMPEASKRRVAELGAERSIPVIEDDVYGDLSFDGSRPNVIKSYDEDGWVMHCSSISKTIAPGYRVGWVAGGRFHRQVASLKFASSCSTATLPQMAVADFLQYRRFMHSIRAAAKIYAENTRLMAAAVRSYFPEGTIHSTPQGGFVLWVELPAGRDSLQLYAEAIRRGINFMPGPAFSAQRRYRSCLRLNASVWSPKVEGALKTLGELARTV